MNMRLTRSQSVSFVVRLTRIVGMLFIVLGAQHQSTYVQTSEEKKVI